MDSTNGVIGTQSDTLGQLPIMAIYSKFQIGNLNAQSFFKKIDIKANELATKKLNLVISYLLVFFRSTGLPSQNNGHKILNVTLR